MSDRVLRDAEVRRRISSCLDQTFLVEAGAGSGKTACLVERMIALLAAGRCQPEQLAAVTFTRKAAGELKERFQVELEKRCREEASPETRKRLSQALEQLQRCFVGTIHSFCARLLRERPLEAGISPDFGEVEGWDEKILEEAAWEDYLAEVGADRPELLEQLEALDMAAVDLRAAFGELNRYPDVEMQAVPLDRPDFSEVREELQELLARGQACLPSAEPEQGWDVVQDLILTGLRWQSWFDLNDDRYLLRLLKRLDRALSIKSFTQYKWGKRHEERGHDSAVARKMGKADAEEFLSAFQQFRDDYVQPALKAWKEYRHYPLLEFVQRGVERYRETRRRENLLTFQDLLMLTARLLRQNPEVRRYFQERFTHLLVDEFQDTDPVQAEIAFYLAGEDAAEQDWTRLHPRPGSLFVVGDPKQSIYRFRRADIATYDRVKRIIRERGELLELTTNFRSQPALIQLADRAFAALFDPISPPCQAEFAPMDEHRGSASGCAEGSLKMVVGAVKGDRKDRIAQVDAEQIGEWIRRAVDGEIRLDRTPGERAQGLGAVPVPGDFLIIVHYKDDMSLYARALEARDLPFTISGRGDMRQADELREVLYLLQALADPDNPVPLVAALRGLFFGFSDDLLYRYRAAGGRFSFLSRVPEAADAEVEQAFASAWEQLRRYRDWTRRHAPSAALEMIVDDLGLIPHALTVEGGRGRVGSVLQALEFMRHRELGGGTDLAGALDFLERLLEEGVDEEVAIDGGSASAVRIINLHRAKGLEAPVVLLANPGNAKSHEPYFHVERAADRAAGYLVIAERSWYNNIIVHALPPEWEHWCEEERRYQAAEGIRLLYVAATRAKNLLVVSTYPGKPEKSPWHLLETFLEEGNSRDAFSILDAASASAPSDGKDAKEEKPPPVTKTMLNEASSRRSGARERLRKATYSRHAGADVHSDAPAPRRQTRGKGMEWGLVVHAALEELAGGLESRARRSSSQLAVGSGGAGTDARRQELEELAARVLADQGASAGWRRNLADVLQQVEASAFWQRVLGAEKVMCEVPFGYWEGGAYRTGIVDLAWREGENWVLVDYKTDVVEGEEHQGQLVEYYRPQVQFYRAGWEHVTGEAVDHCGLFFTDNLHYAAVD